MKLFKVWLKTGKQHFLFFGIIVSKKISSGRRVMFALRTSYVVPSKTFISLLSIYTCIHAYVLCICKYLGVLIARAYARLKLCGII